MINQTPPVLDLRYRLEKGDWVALRESARAVRYTVFVEEQNIPVDLEWDDLDEIAFHVVIFDGDLQAVATGRLLPDGHIGRLAVLKDYRKQGLGDAVLITLIQQAIDLGYSEIILNAQTSAQGFYTKHAFQPQGSVFMEAGIPHQTMTRQINQTSFPKIPNVPPLINER
jgi:predicted GNAT family N-acyltransferase